MLASNRTMYRVHHLYPMWIPDNKLRAPGLFGKLLTHAPLGWPLSASSTQCPPGPVSVPRLPYKDPEPIVPTIACLLLSSILQALAAWGEQNECSSLETTGLCSFRVDRGHRFSPFLGTLTLIHFSPPTFRGLSSFRFFPPLVDSQQTFHGLGRKDSIDVALQTAMSLLPQE